MRAQLICGRSIRLNMTRVERTRDYGLRVAQHLELVLDEHEERGFEDGEHKIRPLVNVRRHDVFVAHLESSGDRFRWAGMTQLR